jgi:hypothetical protein
MLEGETMATMRKKQQPKRLQGNVTLIQPMISSMKVQGMKTPR